MNEGQDGIVMPQKAALTALAATEELRNRSEKGVSRALEERKKVRDQISKVREADLKDRANLVEKIMELDLRFKELAADKKSIDEECEKLRWLLREARTSDIEVSSLRDEMEALERRLSEAELDKHDAKEEVAKVEGKVQSLSAEIDRLKGEALKDRESLTEARRDRDEWKEAFLEVQEAVNELMSETDNSSPPTEV